MRRMLVSVALAAGLLVPATADAAIDSVMGGAVACAVQANGQRFCGTGAAAVPSFDGTPIDVSVAFPPAPASGPEGPYPVIGLYHGWGGSKIVPTSTPTSDTQRALARGYAVFSMTDRGWGRSCFNPRPQICTDKPGYIHLMHNAYEVHDAQYCSACWPTTARSTRRRSARSAAPTAAASRSRSVRCATACRTRTAR